MKLVARIAAIVVAIVVVLLAAAVPVVYFNQHRIVVKVLATIGNQTGVDITPSASRIHMGDHLIVELENPHVLSGGREVIAAERIRAVINFHALLTHGLPLHELDLEGPTLILPFKANAAAAGPIPRPGRELIDETMNRLGDLAHISRKFVISSLELRDNSGKRWCATRIWSHRIGARRRTCGRSISPRIANFPRCAARGRPEVSDSAKAAIWRPTKS